MASKNTVVEATQVLQDAGWRFVRHAKGSHELWECPCGQHHRYNVSSSGGTRLLVTYATKAVRRCRRDNREEQS